MRLRTLFATSSLVSRVPVGAHHAVGRAVRRRRATTTVVAPRRHDTTIGIVMNHLVAAAMMIATAVHLGTTIASVIHRRPGTMMSGATTIGAQRIPSASASATIRPAPMMIAIGLQGGTATEHHLRVVLRSVHRPLGRMSVAVVTGRAHPVAATDGFARSKGRRRGLFGRARDSTGQSIATPREPEVSSADTAGTSTFCTSLMRQNLVSQMAWSLCLAVVGTVLDRGTRVSELAMATEAAKQAGAVQPGVLRFPKQAKLKTRLGLGFTSIWQF